MAVVGFVDAAHPKQAAIHIPIRGKIILATRFEAVSHHFVQIHGAQFHHHGHRAACRVECAYGLAFFNEVFVAVVKAGDFGVGGVAFVLPTEFKIVGFFGF